MAQTSNSNKRLIVLEHNKNLELDIESLEQDQEIYMIDLLPGDSEINLKVNLKPDSKSLIHILILNFDQYSKKITTHLMFDNHYAECENNVQVIGFNKSITAIQLNGTIGKNTRGNAVYQNINASLFDEAKVIGEPNLIINSNDVKAGHSLKVGSISQDILFYLQSRGISHYYAIRLILESFFNEVFMNFDDQIKNKYADIINTIFDKF